MNLQLPSAKLYYDAMKLRPLAELMHTGTSGIIMNLLCGGTPLLGGLCLELVFRQIFQFHNPIIYIKFKKQPIHKDRSFRRI